MSRSDNLKRLLYPKTIAFVGGQGLADTIEHSGRFGFAGDIWIVNPKRDEIAGRACYPTVEDLPAAPDAAFVGVSREATLPVVAALAARGAGGCVCYAAGFAEAGEDGMAREQALRGAAGDMAIVGPNCYGLLNYLDGVALFPAPYGGARVERGVAIVSQSGNVSLNLTMHERSLPLSFVISAGNQAVTHLGDYIDALVDDPRVSAIGLYVEGLKDVEGFAGAARKALANGVPIVAMKVGTSQLGEQMTYSHTSSISGPEELHQALFRRLAIPQVGSLPALLESLKLLTVTGPLPGRRLGVLTASGGDATLVADLAAREGFHIPPLSPQQAEYFRNQLAPFAAISNPLDYNNPLWGDRAGMAQCFTTMMRGDTDLTLMVLDYPKTGMVAREDWNAAIDAFITAKTETDARAAVVSTLPEALPEDARDRLIAAGIAPLQGLDGLQAALSSAAGYHEMQGMAADAPSLMQLASLTDDPAALDEWASKQKLVAWGLTTPAGRVVAPAAAVAAASALGFPVVAKVVSARLAHKTETGSVCLNLGAEESVRDAVAGFDRLAQTDEAPRILVERMIEEIVAELIIGVERDRRFGFALVLGSGGVFVDLVDDNQTLLLPIDRREIATTIDSLRIGRLVNGFRGHPPGDRDATIDAVIAVARFAEEHRDRLFELEINPLAVLRKGHGAVVLDAVIRMA